MNQTTSVNPLSATIAIHDLIADDEMFAGYDGSIDAFNTLYREVEAIITQLIHPDVLDMENVIETFYGIQDQIGMGEVAVDWYR